MLIDYREIRHFHLFCGLGGGAKGFNKSKARVGNMVAKYRCIGGVDVDQAGLTDFAKLTGVKGTLLDMFDREQYKAFHGKEPPSNWREATPADIRIAAGNERPHIVFLSAPCKGFSGLLSENKSKTDKYQALNRLTLRGVWLMLEAWQNDPPELIVFENVPRIANRGRHLLDQIVALLQSYGYATAETAHDCGHLGGLAQSRRRFLLVARHIEKVPTYLYEPIKKPLRAVGEILGKMPLPGDMRAGPMHRIPALQWKTWVRLAFVEAGSDWRSLNKLAVEDGKLKDYLLVPEYRGGYMGVNKWDDNTGTIAGRSNPTNGNFSVADPRYNGLEYSQYGVLNFDQSMGAISGQSMPGGGKYAVADPRIEGTRHNNVFRVVGFDETAGTITSGGHPTSGGQAIADPRTGFGESTHSNVLHVTDWDSHSKVIAGGSHPSGGALCVADPRPEWENRYGNLAVMDWESPSKTIIAGGKGVQGGYLSVADPRTGIDRDKGDNYLTGGHYGVIPWNQPSGAVSSAANIDNGRWSVADPRLPDPDEKLVAVIRSMDNTWHRPFTTLDLAALQSLVDVEMMFPQDMQTAMEIGEYLMNAHAFDLDGTSDQAKRERIGNAVPPDAAEAIGSEMGMTLLLSWSGETFQLSSASVWVSPVTTSLAASQPGVF